jgi:hypothetical protein
MMMTKAASSFASLRLTALSSVLAWLLALGACSSSTGDEGPTSAVEAGSGGADGGGRGGAGSGASGGGGASGAGTGASPTGEAGTTANGTDSGIGDAGSGAEDIDSGIDAGAGSGGSGSPNDDGICTSDGACEEVVQLEPAQHIEGDIEYGELPPAGGPHNPCWDDYGVHDELLPPENWVHNLEHGGVVYLYDCPDGCDAEVSMLEDFVGERPRAILTRFDGLTTRFAVVAWGYRLMTDELDLDAFRAFYDAHADRAPESVSSGKPAGCL